MPLILLMSAYFLQKFSIFLAKNSTDTQSSSMRAALKISSLLFKMFLLIQM